MPRVVVKVRHVPFFTATHGRTLPEPTTDATAIEVAALHRRHDGARRRRAGRLAKTNGAITGIANGGSPPPVAPLMTVPTERVARAVPHPCAAWHDPEMTTSRWPDSSSPSG